MSMKLRSLLAAVCLSALAIWAGSVQTLAQSDGSEWATPVNLSDSGAASSPVIVVVPDGTLRILWWDQFDGLMVSDGSVSTLGAPAAAGSESDAEEGWSTPAQVLIPTRVLRGGVEQVIPLPLGFMPDIVGDADGRAHAFWLGQPDVVTGNRSLQYSRLGLGETTWASPRGLAGSASSLDATVDVSGTLHLAYVQPVPVQESPVGLYYMQSRNGGLDWTAPTPIFLSRYLRLLSGGQNDLRLTANDRNSVYATWNDPQEGKVLVSHSDDSGVTWSEPRPFAASANQPWENQAIALPGGSEPLLWDRTGEGQGVMIVSGSDDALKHAVWDGARWSETKYLALRIQDPERGELLRLSEVQLVLMPPPPDQEEVGEMLILVGIDQNSDLRITDIQMEELERLFDRPSEDFTSVESGEEQETSPPAAVNLSHSGAASNPVIVSSFDDTLRALWWDQFDGLMIADGTVLATSVLSGTQEIVTLRDFWSEPRPVPLSSATTPRILADANGGVYAFWLQGSTGGGQVAAQGAGAAVSWPLMYSQLTTDGTAWLPPVVLAESGASFDVTADVAGALYLAYVQTVDTPSSPSGIYFRRAEEGGAHWSAPVALDQSRYIRLLSPGTAHVRLAADDAGGVYVTWDDPRLEQLTLAYSSDGGVTWDTSVPMVASEGLAQHGQLVAVPGREALLLWEDRGASAACSLYQAPAAEVANGATAPGQRILEELAQCPDDAQFLPLAEGQVLMVTGTGSDALILAVWNGERWSEPRRLGYSFTDPEMARQVYLGNLHVALVGLSASATEGPEDKALMAVGVDPEGDVWATSSQMGTLEMVFAPLPPWSAPVDFAQSQGDAGLPVIASDSEGRLHVLWSDAPVPGEPGAALLYSRRDEASTASGSEVRWTSPAQVLPSADGRADQPALIVVGDQLHAVWRGGQNAQIFHSQAFVGDAYAASGWREPQPLPASAALASWPDVAAGIGGTLHVVYAVPVNEGRGIYYTRSEDGESWSEARQIFDAAGADWAMSDYPRLAVGLDGTIHVVWIRADPLGKDLTQEIYYARSVDGGETWSEPLMVVEGVYAWPEIAAGSAGTVQLLWNEATGERSWWHQWSTDSGIEWTRPERVPGFRNAPGPVGLVADGSGIAHLVGLGQDGGEAPALLYMAWDGEQWGERETFRLDLAQEAPLPGVSAAALPSLGQLDVVFRGQGKEGAQIQQINLWHTAREVPIVVLTPVPTATPWPTPTPLPTATPMALPTQTPSFGQASPQDSGGSVGDLLPLLLPGGLVALIVAGAFGLGFLRTRRRR